MARQEHTLFLEEWLRSNSGSSSNINSRSSASSARAIIQAWADLRSSLENQAFHPHQLQSLKTLLSSQASLYVADPQAKLLISIISSRNISLPPESYSFFFKLLYIWVRKSSKPSSVLIDSAVEVISDHFSMQFDSDKISFYFSEVVLLLGAFTLVPSVSKKSKTFCLELLSRLLEEEYRLIGSSDLHIPNVLAGIGYALSSSENIYFVRIIDSLFGIWNREDGPSGSVSHGLMILYLTEWVLSSYINSHSFEKVNDFAKKVLETPNLHHASFATVMAAAGVLRVSSKSLPNALQLRISAEKKIETVALDLMSETGGFTNSARKSLLMKCIALALAKSSMVSFRASLFVCLASVLLTEIFPLKHFYTRVFKYLDGSLEQLSFNEVKDHLNSTHFKEAGAITGVFCNQYASADEDSRSIVEGLIWDYCQDVYLGHRQIALMLRGRQDELLSDLEKVAESAFLMVVVFSLAVTKHKFDSKCTVEKQMEISVKILISFSCMEYFRRMRLPEYMDTIRAVVVAIQENESACVLFVESLPSYSDLINQPGCSSLQKMGHTWSKDEVQTSRILFHLRVIPTCIEHLPAPIFRKVVAPIMFSYMCHPNGKVARASHSVFVAFVSSGKDSNEGEKVFLKEQLVFYYIQRSLEGYPGLTPFEGMASGIGALVRHLVAGSPSIFYTIHSLVEKARNLSLEIVAQDADLWRNWQGELEPCKKILDLLIRLLSLVDIQVLPSLMKQLAQLIVSFPEDGQNVILNELYDQVAESDDVTRKPTLVSWLQSLAYLCSQAVDGAGTSKRVGHKENASFARTSDQLSLNGVCFIGVNAKL